MIERHESWRHIKRGDIVRAEGIVGRRFRFFSHVKVEHLDPTSLAEYCEVVDLTTGGMRYLRPERLHVDRKITKAERERMDDAHQTVESLTRKRSR